MEGVNHLVWILTFYDACAMFIKWISTLKMKLFSGPLCSGMKINISGWLILSKTGLKWREEVEDEV